MKIEFLEGKQGGNLKFEVDGTVMYFWDSFKRSLISLDHFAQSYNFNKVMFKDTPEDITKWIEENQDFITSYINHASAEQARLDTFKKLPKKKLVARLEGGVLIAEISLERGYVAVTGRHVVPMAEESMIEMGTETMVDFYVGEEKMTEEAAKEQVQQDIRSNGIEAVWDISLFSDGFTHEGVDYLFDSVGCGCLHSEIKKAFPNNKALSKLIKKHLSPAGTEELWLFSQIKASEDFRKEVLEIGEQIISGK